MAKLRVLHLSLKWQPFEVMVTGEKQEEFRADTRWIRGRLLNSDGSRRKYDVVKFTNGYGKHRPQFVAEFIRADQMIGDTGTARFSNGLQVDVKAGMWVITLGKVGITRNLPESLQAKINRNTAGFL